VTYRLRAIPAWLAVSIAALAVGGASVGHLQLVFAAMVAGAGVAALGAPSAVWVLSAIVAALTFRGLVGLGALPSVATFVDMPLSWGALLVALVKLRERSAFLRRYLRWLAGLALATLLAWAFNPSEVLRPIVYVMLLGEPFALVGALVADPPSVRMRRMLERSLFGLVLSEIAFAAIEVARYGAPSDHIQGSFYGAGAGANLGSAVMIVGGIWILSGGVGRRAPRAWRLLIVAALFFIPFLADAKQVIFALPAIVLASSWKGGRLQLVLRTALAVGSVAALITLDPAGRTALWFIQRNQQGHSGKEAAALLVWHQVHGDPASVVFGKGPAETVSRAAFMTTSLYQRSGSPLAVLGLKPAAIAIEAQQAAAAASGGGSSINQGVSSALGVLGDLGLFGGLMYGGLFLSLFARLRTERSAEGIAAACGFAMFVVLGLVFDWWEQPGFGVLLGGLAGLALSRSVTGGPASIRVLRRAAVAR
jgi:hypothetical protein